MSGHPRLPEGESASPESHEHSHRGHSINRHRQNTGSRVDILIGREMKEASGLREEFEKLQNAEEPAHRHSHHEHSAHIPARGMHVESGTGVETLAKEGLTDANLLKNAAKVGAVSAGSMMAVPTLLQAPALALGGSPGLAAVATVAPLGGAALGYMVGKKFGHPVVGTSVGAGAASLGALAGTAALGINGYAGLATVIAAAPAIATTAFNGVVTYGLGEIHNYIFENTGDKRPGILGTFARGIVSPITIPAGLIGYRMLGIGRKKAK